MYLGVVLYHYHLISASARKTETGGKLIPRHRPSVFAWRKGVASPAGKPGKAPGEPPILPGPICPPPIESMILLVAGICGGRIRWRPDNSGLGPMCWGDYLKEHIIYLYGHRLQAIILCVNDSQSFFPQLFCLSCFDS